MCILLFHLVVYSLVASGMCPVGRSNPQPRHVGTDAPANGATTPGTKKVNYVLNLHTSR